jgi:hypothetical protein
MTQDARDDRLLGNGGEWRAACQGPRGRSRALGVVPGGTGKKVRLKFLSSTAFLRIEGWITNY